MNSIACHGSVHTQRVELASTSTFLGREISNGLIGPPLCPLNLPFSFGQLRDLYDLAKLVTALLYTSIGIRGNSPYGSCFCLERCQIQVVVAVLFRGKQELILVFWIRLNDR